MVCGRIIVFCKANATTEGPHVPRWYSVRRRRDRTVVIWVGACTLCLFFGRASGFATAGVEVGGFRVGTTDEEERLGSLPTKIAASWRFERADSQEWQVCLAMGRMCGSGFNTMWVGRPP